MTEEDLISIACRRLSESRSSLSASEITPETTCALTFRDVGAVDALVEFRCRLCSRVVESCRLWQLSFRELDEMTQRAKFHATQELLQWWSEQQ